MPRRETTKQEQARARSWKIFRLRGLYAQLYALTGPRRTIAQGLVDQELELIGAETETARHARRRRELDERYAEDVSEALEPIPF